MKSIVKNTCFNAKQKGASTLTVVLLLLLAITLPGIALMRSTMVQEQMSSSGVDRARSFQVAEATLIEAEHLAATKPEVPTSGCSSGLCATPEGSPPWKSAGFWDGNGARISAFGDDNIEGKYIVEFLGVSAGGTDDCTTAGDISPDAQCDEETYRYRITARSITDTGAEVILQTNFLVP